MPFVPPLTREQRDVAESVGEIVDAAAISPERWAEALDELVRRVPGAKVGLQIVDTDLARGLPVQTSGFDPGVVEAYARHFGAINPWTPVMVGARSLEVLYSEKVMPASTFRHTEFYADWLMKGRGIDASTGIKLLDCDGRLGVLVTHYEVRRADAMNHLLAPVLAHLGPRIRRAIDAQRAIAATSWDGTRQTLLEAFVEPALLLTRDLRVISLNAAARILAEDGDLYRVGAYDQLVFRNAGVGRTFEQEVERATRKSSSCAARPDLGAAVAVGDLSYSIGAFAMRSDVVDAGWSRLWLPRMLALVVIRASCPRDDLRRRLADTYGLTPAEIELVLQIDGAQTLAQVASTSNINYETARSRLRRIFLKMDVGRQAELVALLTHLRSR